MCIDVRAPRVRALLRRLLRVALAQSDPARMIRRLVARTKTGVRVGTRRYDLRRGTRLIVVGAGKASARMAAALEQCLGRRIDNGLVVVKRGHRERTRRVTVVEAGHPVPDHAGQRAAARLLNRVNRLSPDDLLIVLLSGGASSLLPLPAAGLTLSDKQRTTNLLLRCGASINEMNAIRKHLSAIKGGQLAAATKARVVSLILSDVIGDDLGTIGSGVTAPDRTTYADAVAILRRYHVWRRVPVRVRRYLLAGKQGARAETPKPGAPVFRRVHNLIIGNNRGAVDAVAREARRAGFHPFIHSTALRGEARKAARVFGRLARRILSQGRPVRPPACVIVGGELTITVRGSGRGGRAQEFALAGALEIAGLERVWLAAFGTDGTDGPTDAAGAVTDGTTVARAARRGIVARAALHRNDSYSFFKRAGGHLITGPTGTNVNDVHLLIVT